MDFAVVRPHPQGPAAATSITRTGAYLGGRLGPLAFGAVAAAHGYPAAWLAGATVLLVAAALMVTGYRLLAQSTARSAGPVGDDVAE